MPVMELPDYGVSHAAFCDSFGYQWMLHQMHKEISFQGRVELWEGKRISKRGINFWLRNYT